MGGIRKRKTSKTNSKVSRKPKNRYNISFAGVHPLVHQNWDKSKTLKQNYEALGLVSHVQGLKGGVGGEGLLEKQIFNEEKEVKVVEVEWRKSIDDKEQVQERIEPEIRVEENVKRIGTRLNAKSLRSLDSKQVNPIIKKMEEESLNVSTTPRYQSEQETLVFEALVAKYGLDYEKMAKDRKLNKYQLSAGQIKRKIKLLVKV